VIEALGVAPVFSESYRAKRLPENLSIYFGPPEEYFMAGLTPQETYDRWAAFVSALPP
jgi:hypothetical protein